MTFLPWKKMIRNWYNVPLWVTQFNSTALTELKRASAEQTYTQHLEWRSHGLSDPTFESNPLDHLPYVLKEIQTNTLEYLAAIDSEYTHYTAVNSWFTCTQPGEYAHVHDHPGTDVSGVVYVDAHADQGDIFFPRPFDQFGMSKLLEHLPDHYSLAPETARAVLFPSWLKHGVRTNTSSTNRVSFSWNGILHK